MSARLHQKLLLIFAALLLPVSWLATRFDPYQIDGDAVSYMDLADLLHDHRWHDAVNSYWHPLYPAALAFGQALFHPSRWTELSAYYFINWLIFLLEAAAMWWFCGALAALRAHDSRPDAAPALLGGTGLRFLGLGLLLMATQNELSMGKVRPDALLQALMMFAFAAMLSALASGSLVWTPLIGLFFGLGFLTKSFALTPALLTIVVMALYAVLRQRRSLRWAAASVALALIPLVLLVAPLVHAMSAKYGHLDFGDSGALNLAWYVGGTEKMHLQPEMTGEFGTADVHLLHPNQRLQSAPDVFSYKQVPVGTYPDWFDAAWWNDGIKPHLRLRPLLARDTRNAALIFRYFLNHPPAWVLLLLVLAAGARLRGGTRNENGWFWLPVIIVALAMWAMYGLVNIEERYVTLAYLLVVLPLFAALRSPRGDVPLVSGARFAVMAFAFLALAGSLQIALASRRELPAGQPAWRATPIFPAAEALAALGVKPGDEVACLGTATCLGTQHLARLAGVRMLTEIYAPDQDHLLAQWESLPNRAATLATVRGQGAKVMLADFPAGERAPAPPESEGWRRLGETDFYALPLNISFPPAEPARIKPWVSHAETNQ